MGMDFPGGSSWSVGPSGEAAWADRYAVFYKNGTYDFGRPDCAWYNQLPQGFSAEKDLYQSENATEALKDSFLFLAMKFSSRWQTKKVALALGTKFIMVLMMEGNTTWMTLMVRIAKLKVMVEVAKKF